jgi:hypothetical protein
VSIPFIKNSTTVSFNCALLVFEEVFADTKPDVVEISELSELPELVKTMME